MKRNDENKGLPPYWRYKGKPDAKGRRAITYQVVRKHRHLFNNQSEFTLGRTLADAYRVFAERIGDDAIDDAPATMIAVINRYLLEVTPTKAPKTQVSERDHLEILKSIFINDPPAAAIEPKHCFQIRDSIARRRTDQVANKVLGTLSAVFTKAIEWGTCNEHPIKGKVGKISITGRKERVRDKTPSLEEIDAALEYASPMLVAHVGIKLQTGLRRTDILRMEWKLWDRHAQILDMTPKKTAMTTGVQLVFGPNDELTSVMNHARTIMPLSPYVIHNRKGESYLNEYSDAPGFKSAWQRWMAKVERAGLRTFAERYIRNRVATEQGSIVEAAHVLGIDPRVVSRHYFVGGHRIQKVKGKS